MALGDNVERYAQLAVADDDIAVLVLAYNRNLGETGDVRLWQLRKDIDLG